MDFGSTPSYLPRISSKSCSATERHDSMYTTQFQVLGDFSCAWKLFAKSCGFAPFTIHYIRYTKAVGSSAVVVFVWNK